MDLGKKGSILKKGSSVNISKTHAGLKKLRLALMWEFKPGQDADLDASALMLGSDGKTLGEGTMAWHKNLVHCRQAVVHQGDIRSADDLDEGENMGKETIDIDLSLICEHVKEILAVITTYSEEEPVLFGRVKNAGVVLSKLKEGGATEALYNCDLSEDISNYTSMEVARFYRDEKGEWNFQPVGKGIGKSPLGFRDVLLKYNPYFKEEEEEG